MHDDFYQMYLEELEGIPACTPEEEHLLLTRIGQGDEQAKQRLIEGNLKFLTDMVKTYGDRGVPMGDLVQEANMAMVLLINRFAGERENNGTFHEQLRTQVEAALQGAIEDQAQAKNVEEELLARVNVLKDVAQMMAGQLGREATGEELAERMKMTVEEIKAIMKLTLDAMSVSPDAEEQY